MRLQSNNLATKCPIAVGLVFAATVFCCYGRSVHWKFQRQVVDQQGAPITNATVEVSAHGRSPTRGYGQTEKILHTDKAGMFSVDTSWETCFVTVSKQGFVRKRLDLDPALVDPKGFPSSGRIVLSAARKLPRKDRLDKLETQPIDINDFKQGSAVWVSFRPGRVRSIPDEKTLIRVERSTNGFRITCQPGTQGKALQYEPGLDGSMWRASNAFVDEKGLASEFVCPTPPQPSYGNDTAAFVLKSREYWVIATLSMISPIRPEDFDIGYNLSKDNVFVNDSQDEE